MNSPGKNRERILGIDFIDARIEDAVDEAISAGLVVAPSGTCFERFVQDAEYRRAIMRADVVLPDSGLMVMLWRLRCHGSLHRISGLAYLQHLLRDPRFEMAQVFWVLPHERAREKLLSWSAEQGTHVRAEYCYVAPIYGAQVADETLLARVKQRTARQIVIAIGAGAQEKLGFYLRENLPGDIAIHCIGGALGFITGDQVAIPKWADRFYLGWLLRLISQPRVFLPRLWKARVLVQLVSRYGAELPPLQRKT